jgi:hypothetical protein
MKTGLIFREAGRDVAIEQAECRVTERPGPLPRADITSALPILGRLPGAVRAAGLALCAARDDDAAQDEGRFELWVIDAEGRPALCVGHHPESEVVAAWRSLAAASGLTLMVMDAEGVLTTAQAQIGRLRLGALHMRRGHGLLTGRRPRFLVRRKPARLGARPRVHRGERVIIGDAGV